MSSDKNVESATVQHESPKELFDLWSTDRKIKKQDIRLIILIASKD